MPETNPNLQATDTVASFNGAPCLVRLQAMYAKLTTSERRVADVIIAAPAQVVQATIGDVARRSDVGVGTVGRLCSKLGYSGFPALKIALASDLTETKQGVVGYLERGDTLTDVIEKATRIAEQTLHDAAALVDPAALAQAIQALRAAQIVTVYVATGVDWGIARVLLYRLLQCGIPGRILVDVEQQALHARQDAPPMQQRNEVVIALARHTNHVSLQDLLQQVRRRDAHVILLTDMLHSDLAQSADATFVAATRSSGVIVGDVAAYMGLYHLVDVLYSALAITHNDARPQHTGEPPRQKLQTRKIDQLRIAVPYLPKTMDPQQTLSIANGRVYPLVFSTLINRDWTGSDWRLIPGLAASWQRRDAYTLDVTLRNDVTWHDGTPFTVRDVLYSFNRIQSGDQSLHVARSGFWSLDRVEQLDDASLRIITRRPDPFLEMRLASHHVAYIVPAHHHQTVGTDAFAAGDVIGTGPYHLTAWHPGASMEFAANTAYFEGKAAASHVSIIAEGEPAARTEGLLAGHYDLITDVPPDQLDRIAQAGGFRTKSEILGLDYELLFNMQASPLDRREIRQALSLGIDRQRIIDELWQGFAVHPRGSQIPGENYYDQIGRAHV
jgi:DNA-binding MurR/RpiR family transcriptional regulator